MPLVVKFSAAYFHQLWAPASHREHEFHCEGFPAPHGQLSTKGLAGENLFGLFQPTVGEGDVHHKAQRSLEGII